MLFKVKHVILRASREPSYLQPSLQLDPSGLSLGTDVVLVGLLQKTDILTVK